MKKLYKVEMTVYVVAETNICAVEAALEYEVEIAPDDCQSVEVKTVPKNWETAIPWGEEDDRTCAELLKAKDKEAANNR